LPRGEIPVREPIRILHIDSEYSAHYIIIQTGLFIHSRISLQEAVSFLKTTDFHLILSEPHGKAIVSENFPVDEGTDSF
jgi:hypothetical protein